MYIHLLCVGDVAHVHDALMDIMADESFQFPTEANQTCLTTCTCKAMLSKLKLPSVESAHGWSTNFSK